MDAAILDFQDELEMWVDCPYCKNGVNYHPERLDKTVTLWHMRICPICDGNKGWTEPYVDMDEPQMQVRERVSVVRA